MGYENSKIYKLQHEDGHFYIGSTYAELRERLRQHKDKSKNYPERQVYKHINNQWDKVRILLIEDFSCENKDELLRLEDEHIQKELNNPLCLNILRAIIPDEERDEYNKLQWKKYRDSHREERNEYARQYNPAYYEANKEQLREQQADYYEANKEKIKEAVKNYKEEHREEILEKQKQRYEENKAEILAKMKEHRDANKEQINARRRELRALKKLST